MSTLILGIFFVVAIIALIGVVFLMQGEEAPKVVLKGVIKMFTPENKVVTPASLSSPPTSRRSRHTLPEESIFSLLSLILQESVVQPLVDFASRSCGLSVW